MSKTSHGISIRLCHTCQDYPVLPWKFNSPCETMDTSCAVFRTPAAPYSSPPLLPACLSTSGISVSPHRCAVPILAPDDACVNTPAYDTGGAQHPRGPTALEGLLACA